MSKKLFSIVVGLFLTASVFAQAPEKMSYQAVIRNSSNVLVTSTAVGMRLSILQTTATGTAVYAETQSLLTNANGLVSLEIGSGTPVIGTFSGINWANGPYFIKTETDPTGGTNYTVVVTSELLSVPFALHAKCVTMQVSATGDTLTIGCKHIIIPGISAANTLQPQYPAGSVFCASGATAVVEVTNPTTGRVWMDRNLGATQVATSSTDANSYGDLYQWGRRSDGHQCRNSATTTTLSSTDQPAHGSFILAPSSPNDWRNPQNNSLWQGVSGTNNPCPTGFRLPTETEWNAERVSWNSSDAAGALASPLKFPMAGSRNVSSGSLFDFGIRGYYWSMNSTVSGTDSRLLGFNSSAAGMGTFSRALGSSVRCLKD